MILMNSRLDSRTYRNNSVQKKKMDTFVKHQLWQPMWRNCFSSSLPMM